MASHGNIDKLGAGLVEYVDCIVSEVVALGGGCINSGLLESFECTNKQYNKMRLAITNLNPREIQFS